MAAALDPGLTQLTQRWLGAGDPLFCSFHQRLNGLQRRSNNLIHVVVTILRKAPYKQRVRLGICKLFVFLIERFVIGTRNGVIGIAFGARKLA